MFSNRRTTGTLAVTLAVVTGLTAGAPASAAAPAGPALTLDVSAGRHAISPDIYGVNFADTATAAQMGVTVDRFGGNAASRFNYLINTTNTGSDWYYENVPSSSASSFISADRAAHLRTVWTLPMTGWV